MAIADLTQAVPRVTHKVSAEQAREAATGFALDHLGNQLVPGQPYLMISAHRTVWVVPIELSYIHTGPIGTVGYVAVDEEMGLVTAWTPIDEMKAASRKLRESREPQISEDFKAYMQRIEEAQIGNNAE